MLERDRKKSDVSSGSAEGLHLLLRLFEISSMDNTRANI